MLTQLEIVERKLKIITRQTSQYYNCIGNWAPENGVLISYNDSGIRL